jgi:hypothetical protein
MKNIEIIYCNGCSHSAGGGLELDKHLSDDITLVKDYYKQRYNIEWDTKIETTYSYKLSRLLGCDVVNEAESGGGPERVIRMGYEFVKKNWDKKDKIFLILEIPSSNRLELYSKKLEDYLITNLQYKDESGYDNDDIDYFFACRNYDITPAKDFEKIGDENLKNYLDNFHSKKSQFKKMLRETELFLSWLKLNNVKFIFFTSEICQYLPSYIKNNNMLKLKVGNTIYSEFHHYSVETKSTIADETDLRTLDLHPGYFAHTKFAELMVDYIKEKYDTF